MTRRRNLYLARLRRLRKEQTIREMEPRNLPFRLSTTFDSCLEIGGRPSYTTSPTQVYNCNPRAPPTKPLTTPTPKPQTHHPHHPQHQSPNPPSIPSAEKPPPASTTSHSLSGSMFSDSIRPDASLPDAPAALHLTEWSMMLYDHYLTSTRTIMCTLPLDRYSLPTCVIHFAQSDSLLLHTLLAVSGAHLNFNQSFNDILHRKLRIKF